MTVMLTWPNCGQSVYLFGISWGSAEHCSTLFCKVVNLSVQTTNKIFWKKSPSDNFQY